jgi:hypothetical protein
MDALSPLKIVMDTPDPRYQPDVSGLYLSGFDNHTVDGDHLWCAENAVKQKRDIEVRVFSLREIKKGDLAFPTLAAEEMKKRGAALMIVLTPWAETNSQDDLFTNEDILAGKHYDVLRAFAEGAEKASRHWRKAGVPVLVTWAPTPQAVDKFPWGKNKAGQPDPELYKRTFRYVHKVVEDYFIEQNTDSNLTWVYTAQAGPDVLTDDPGPGYREWISLSGFARNGESFAQIFEPSLRQIKAADPKLDIMIGDYGISPSDLNGNPVDRAKIFEGGIALAASGRYRIGAINYHNVNEKGEAWAILDDAEKAAFAQALKNQDDLFRRAHGLGLYERTIRLADGTYLKSGQIDPPKKPCGEIEGRWYDWFWKKEVSRLERSIEIKENCVPGNLCEQEPNLWHKIAAKRYLELAIYMQNYDEKKRDGLIKRAKEHVELGLNTHDNNAIFYNWPPIDFVPYYFDLKMESAEIYRDYGSHVSARPGQPSSELVCREILSSQTGVHNAAIRRAHDVGDESVGGIVARTNSILADDKVMVGDQRSLLEAIGIYDEVINWEKLETDCDDASCTWLPLFFKHGKGNFDITPAPEVKYVGKLAELGKAEALVRLIFFQPGRKEELLKQANEIYTDVLNWDLVGREKGFLQNGFMDLALKAIIGAMKGCVSDWDWSRDINDLTNMKLAAKKFEDVLPWDKINKYDDLKKSLGLTGADLGPLPPGQSSTRKWQLLINRLRYAPLTPRDEVRFNSVYDMMPSEIK